jgi:hypothetical protein
MWSGGYSVKLAVPDATGEVWAHYDEVRIVDGLASRHITSEFIECFDTPGVYGLTDPLADNIVYVGRSGNIGARFRQHMADTDTKEHPGKRRLTWDLVFSGQKLGLCVLSTVNSPERERLWIGRLQPIFNLNHIPRSER